MKIKTISVLILLQFLFLFNVNAQDTAFNPDEIFPKDSLVKWTTELFSSLSEIHPNFYTYTSKEEFDSIIPAAFKDVTKPLKTIEYYRKIKPLYAKIGCLHTDISLNEVWRNYAESASKLVPVSVFIDDDKNVFIVENLSDNPDLLVKSKILAINDKPIDDIVTTLLNAIPSDGYNQTLKLYLLNFRFAFWYRTMIEFNDKFNIKIKVDDTIKTVEVKGVDKSSFPSFEEQEKVNEKQLDFEVTNGNAFLKINSFSNSAIKENGQNFKRYLKNVFKKLNQQNIKTLVIDVRNNTGGSDSNAVLLASYFFDEPFRYWDRIEVREKIANQISGINRLFYKKPVNTKDPKNRIWLKAKLTKEFDFYEVQKPAKNGFQGDVYILTNGLCMSSCGDFVAVLSHNKKAKTVGQETGGGYQGNTSGMMPENVVFKNLVITTPMQKYVNFVDLKKNFGRGTIPDFKVKKTLEDRLSKKDAELEFVKSLLEKLKD
tara:strand:+ start:27969 stop:29426 length:1458 start_codon:yes stop_codon:yes gene_type:complete